MVVLEDPLLLVCHLVLAREKNPSTANVLILATGAGWSADSGLKVYNDVARTPEYAALGLDYAKLCEPVWLERDPALFYGFWGSCFNDYRAATLHQGYDIIQKWKQRVLAKNPQFCQSFEATVRGLQQTAVGHTKEILEEDKDAKSPVSPFFIYTSNVDAHFERFGFQPQEIREIHGNIETWQCGDYHCSMGVWRAPSWLSFQMADPIRVLDGPAPSLATATTTATTTTTTPEPTTTTPTTTTTETKTTETKTTTAETAATTATTTECLAPDQIGFQRAHPRCPKCGGLARPNILMFGDSDWIENSAQQTRYSIWRAGLFSEFKQRKELPNEPQLRAVIIEIGCGHRVPSVRWHDERLLRDLQQHATLIRVNPEERLADCRDNLIALPCTGLTALQQLDRLLSDM